MRASQWQAGVRVPDDDPGLAARIRAGDTAAFGALLDVYYDGLLGFVRQYVRDAAAAEDLLQDVLFRVWESRQTFGLRGSVKSYLYHAARNHAVDWLRRGRLERDWVRDVTHQPPEFAEGADAATRQNETAVAVARAIEALPAGCRAVFLLRRARGLTNVEVGQALGISPKAVDQQLWRALKLLRKRLTPFLGLLFAVSSVAARARL